VHVEQKPFPFWVQGYTSSRSSVPCGRVVKSWAEQTTMFWMTSKPECHLSPWSTVEHAVGLANLEMCDRDGFAKLASLHIPV
jgi:hypothetical protein